MGALTSAKRNGLFGQTPFMNRDARGVADMLGVCMVPADQDGDYIFRQLAKVWCVRR